MEKVILFILATSGLSWILCKSKLFKAMREYFSEVAESIEVEKSFNKKIFPGKETLIWTITSLFSCVGCFGFWTAQFNYVLIFKQVDIEMIAFGFIGSITSLLIVSYISFLERK
jgi:Protein of unknown function (DUF1360)